MLFTGTMDYEPNVRAMQWFCEKILPRIRQMHAQAHLHIAGANPAQEVRSLACDHVVVHGKVPDMKPHFDAAEIVVVPLQHGGGTRLKILDAAACGKPIVSTSLGAEGLQCVPGRDLQLADTDEEFSRVVGHLLTDGHLRSTLGQSARKFAEAYDWQRITRQFLQLIDSFEPSGAKSSEG
jgi:glycosyltransferase involved in cell wall biosynthesis